MNENFYKNMILNHKMCYNINTKRENKNRMLATSCSVQSSCLGNWYH
ncbi:hypothetical protein CLOSBL3_10893 [Clostridiaceae bacterium BL-3]|nr:hypothetical protein CLOSBL3_10893 [Clostridiaceae bacterium BL-3]